MLHGQQGDYFDEVVLGPVNRGGQPPRPVCVFESMNAKPGGEVRMDTGTPRWLEKSQIEK